MKNLFDPKVKDEILSRIEKLTPDSKAGWGNMNVNQALHHMSMAFDVATGNLNVTPSKVPPMPKWLLKFFLMNVKPPKAKVETFVEMNMVANNMNPADFETERNNLKQAVENFHHGTSFLSENKLAGKFKKSDWGKLNYNHTDHHLRQFGV